MSEQEYRTGDKVRPRPPLTVVRVRGDGLIKTNDGQLWSAGNLELVERPGPRLEDLPEGAILDFGDGNGWEVSDDQVLYHLGDAWDFADVDRPFTVIGAKPGTPAWELWAAAFYDQTHYHPEADGEWWVAS